MLLFGVEWNTVAYPVHVRTLIYDERPGPSTQEAGRCRFHDGFMPMRIMPFKQDKGDQSNSDSQFYWSLVLGE